MVKGEWGAEGLRRKYSVHTTPHHSTADGVQPSHEDNTSLPGIPLQLVILVD